MISRRPAYGTATTATGTASFTLYSMRGMIRQIYVTAATSDSPITGAAVSAGFDIVLVDN